MHSYLPNGSNNVLRSHTLTYCALAADSMCDTSVDKESDSWPQ